MNYAAFCARVSNTPEGAALMDVHFDPVVLKLVEHPQARAAGLLRRGHLLGLSLRDRRADEHARAHRPHRPALGRHLPFRRFPGGEEAHGQVHGRRLPRAQVEDEAEAEAAVRSRRTGCDSPRGELRRDDAGVPIPRQLLAGPAPAHGFLVQLVHARHKRSPTAAARRAKSMYAALDAVRRPIRLAFARAARPCARSSSNSRSSRRTCASPAPLPGSSARAAACDRMCRTRTAVRWRGRRAGRRHRLPDSRGRRDRDTTAGRAPPASRTRRSAVQPYSASRVVAKMLSCMFVLG